MRKFIFTILFTFISVLIWADSAKKPVISGYVKDFSTGEELIGASVYVAELKAGTITNEYGFYSLTLPEGKYTITWSFLGFNDITKTIDLKENIRLDVSLEPTAEMIDAVEIIGERKDENIRKVEMSVAKIPMKTVQKMPAFLGEVDILKTIQLLPGVSAGTDGSTGFHVRGGSADQNLVLLDGAPVYNASHFVGFFSVFNSDAVKDFKLYKGGIPAEYGGRLASVLDIHMKEGNMKKISATGGIGLLSSRLTLEGPIIEDRCSFIISGRRTYFDLFLPLAPDTAVHGAKIFFYDLNTKINFKINENNRIFLSGYFGKDVEAFQDMMGINYGNGTGTIRWNHLFSEKLFMNTMFLYSEYNYNIFIEQNLMSADWISGIKDYNLKSDLTYYLNPDNTLQFGIGSIYHIFNPGKITAKMEGMDEIRYELPINNALEHSIYIQNEQKINALLSLQYGIRFSAFQNIGEGTFYRFNKYDPQQYRVMDTLVYEKNELINTYSGFEPRLGIRYVLTENSSIKASYNRMNQYLHLATNTASSTPLDYWFPCSPNIKPQIADQVAIGYFQNLKENSYETSIEVYYKKMDNVIDFRDHAEVLLNDLYEGEVRSGEAYSYGVEFLVKKQEGKFTGWLSYTYSKTMRRIPEINNGNWYFASFDKTHDISAIATYDITSKINVAANWVYSTPQPRTMPTGRFEYQGTIIPVYSDRNSVRLFPYHRLDLSATFYFNKYGEKKVRKNGKPGWKYESSLNVSVYNAYAHKNPISISFKQSASNPDETYAEMMYLFKAVPSITYNFKF